MTKYRRCAALVAASILLSVPARGQETAPAVPPVRHIDERSGLTLDEAITRALADAPAIRGARTDIEAARGRLRQAGLRPNPSLTYESRVEPGGTDRQNSVGVQWPLDLFRRGGRTASARQDLQVAELGVADRERLLVAAVRMQYGLAAAAARDVAVADDLAGAAEDQVALLRARVAQGSTPPLERDLLEVELRRLQAERLLAAGRAESALVQLRELIGLPSDAPLLLRSTLEALVAGDTAPAVVQNVSARADVQEAEARVGAASARVDQARREGRVDVSLFGNYMRMDAGFPQLGFGGGGAIERVRGQFNYLAAGAMVVVPVFNRNQGLVAAAEAERSGSEYRKQAAELLARAEVDAAQARDRHARQAVDLYRTGVRPLARQNLDVIRQTFELGRATVFDVLNEQRRYLDVERAYTMALRDAWEARADLKRALGELR